jgi:hypothetical protein
MMVTYVYVVLCRHPESDSHWVEEVCLTEEQANEVMGFLIERRDGHTVFEVVKKQLRGSILR